jgi:hypothetical protein
MREHIEIAVLAERLGVPASNIQNMIDAAGMRIMIDDKMRTFLSLRDAAEIVRELDPPGAPTRHDWPRGWRSGSGRAGR